MRRLALTLCLVGTLSGCVEAVGDGSNEPSGEDVPSTVLLDRLEEFLVGRFDSSLQSTQQPQYYSIQLLSCPVDAPDLGDRVVYVEQASMDSLSEPYRQRLYVLSADDEAGTAETVIYSLVSPGSWVGLCAEDELATLDESDVELREGCGVQLTWQEDTATFEGGTVGESCSSSLGGAAYATSEVWMSEDRLDSWDRGFDANGFQVWGAVDGPYEFLRQ